MDLVTTPLYRYIVRSAGNLLLTSEETEDIAAILISKHGSDKSDHEFHSFLELPLTSHLRQDLKCDILNYKRTVARRRDRECAYTPVEDDTSDTLKCAASQQRAEGLERRIVLLTLLERLPKDQSVCIQLRFLDQLDTTEIAARLGITTDAVEKRIQRGLKRLRHEWDADDAGAGRLPSSTNRVP